MRLDHLLSKEHLLVPRGQVRIPLPDRSCLGGAHGWNIDMRRQPECCGLSSTPLEGWNGCCSRMGLSAGTLLGPEGSDVSSTFQTVEPPPGFTFVSVMDAAVSGGGHGCGPSPPIKPPILSVGVGCGGGFVRRLRTAQWTRASLISVVKFLRAHGGCLGSRSRRRTL